MVGDQKQLPATVFCENIKALNYDMSLFERLILSGHPYTMLDTQYRMHPDISRYPNKMFYRGTLIDGDNVRAESYLPSYIRPIEERPTGSLATTTSNCSTVALTGGENGSHSGSNGVRFPLFKTFMFFDLQSSWDAQGNYLSLVNKEEARFCANLVKVRVWYDFHIASVSSINRPTK